MKIISLEAANLLRLKAVQLRLDPTGKLIVVGGQNAQGKTSLLDSILIGLSGGRSIPADPVHHGAKNGRVKIELGEGQEVELTVERTVNPDRTDRLTVKDAQGGSFGTPQRMLDALCSKLTFDPLEFARADAKEQVRILERLCGIDSDGLERQRRALYEERTLVGRERDKLKALYDISAYDPDAPKEPAVVAELIEELRKAQAINAENARKRAELEEIERAVADLEARLAALKVKRNALKEAAAELVDADTSALEQEIAQADELNRRFRANEEFSRIAQDWSTASERFEKLTAEIGAIDTLKRQKVREAKLPIAGLDFGEDGVLYRGVPFEQASSAERVRVSVAMGMALNPQLRVMLIREGSLLDENSLAAVAQLAESNDYQVWMERVGEGAESTIVIEDGQIKSAEPVTVPSPETEAFPEPAPEPFSDDVPPIPLDLPAEAGAPLKLVEGDVDDEFARGFGGGQ